MESKGAIVGIIGLGLIGGSTALRLKAAGFAQRVVGFDASTGNLAKALEMGIIEESASIEQLMKVAEVIIIAIPVDASKQLLVRLLDTVQEHQVVLDFGSTKARIAEAVVGHNAAFDTLFEGKVNIICDKKQSSNTSLQTALHITEQLGLRPKYMNSTEHDRHIAYVSHLSHISSFTLGQTVLEVEPNEENIFDMAGSGFESTVRLAKSSPQMWAPIFTENADNIIEVLFAYIANLEKYKSMIENKNEKALKESMQETNRIREVLDKKIQ